MRDESVSKGVLMIGGLIGAIVIVGIIVALVYLVKDKVDDASDTMIKQADGALNSIYTDYDGDIVTGSEVLSAISKFKNDDIFVSVDCGSGTYVYYNKNADLTPSTNTIAQAKDKSDLSKYINPSAKFLGEVMTDTAMNTGNTDTIIGIKFTKQ